MATEIEFDTFANSTAEPGGTELFEFIIRLEKLDHKYVGLVRLLGTIKLLLMLVI
jgi:hypothetical protein